MVAMLLAAVPLAGCLGNGSQVNADDAIEHFERHRDGYEEIVALVVNCRPTRPRPSAHYNRVWASGADRDDLSCQREGQEIEPIVHALKSADAVSVSYFTYDSPAPSTPDSAMHSVSISVYSAGIAVSGSGTDFVYSFQPLDNPPRNEGDAADGVERKAVTGPPYQWVWEQTWT